MAFINFVRDYERIARFRLGKFEGMKGPGIVFLVPLLHQGVRVDTRTEVLEIPKQTNTRVPHDVGRFERLSGRIPHGCVVLARRGWESCRHTLLI